MHEEASAGVAILVGLMLLSGSAWGGDGDKTNYKMRFDVTVDSTKAHGSATSPIPDDYVEVKLRKFKFKHDGGTYEEDGQIGKHDYDVLQARRNLDGADCFAWSVAWVAGDGYSLILMDNARANKDKAFIVQLESNAAALIRLTVGIRKNGRIQYVAYQYGDGQKGRMDRNTAPRTTDVRLERAGSVLASSCVIAHDFPDAVGAAQGENATIGHEHQHGFVYVGCDDWDENCTEVDVCADKTSEQCLDFLNAHDYWKYKHCNIGGNRVVHCGRR